MIVVAILVPVAALGYSLQQQHLYQASAQVLLSRQNLANSLNNVIDPNQSVQPDRLAQTQADLAQTPEVAKRVIQQLRLHRSAGSLLSNSSVTVASNADVLTFNVTDRNPQLAGSMATAFASQYILYRKQLDTAAIRLAQREVEGRIAGLTATGETHSALYTDLVSKDQQLRTMEALQTANASLIRSASGGSQVQPRPVRNAILGLGLGLVLGLGLAFLREALDTRIRTAEDISKRLELPLLARISRPPRAVRAADQLVMVQMAKSARAEPFRVLRANLEFVNVDRGAKTIAVTSALEGEGKSTTAANLAVSLALAGRRVVLVDLDFRKPYLHKFFPLEKRPGLTDAALGFVTLDKALVRVALATASSSKARANGAGKVLGTLHVVGTGPMPPNPGEFIGSSAVVELLGKIAEAADIVILDTAPLLGVGDTLLLSSRIDALLLVTKLKAARRPVMNELQRVLESCPATPLGFILTGAEDEEHYGYGTAYAYAYAYGYGGSERRFRERV